MKKTPENEKNSLEKVKKKKSLDNKEDGDNKKKKKHLIQSLMNK